MPVMSFSALSVSLVIRRPASGKQRIDIMSSYSPKRAASDATKSSSPQKPNRDDKLKKGLIIAILVVLVIIIAAAMVVLFVPGAETGVSNFFSGKSGGYVPETQGETTNITPYYENGILPTTGHRHDITVISGGGTDAAEVTGTWKLDDVTIYMFDGKGRGIMLTAVNNYTFLYSAQDGKLAIDFDSDGGADREYQYVINGDRLTMTFGNQKFEFKKTDTQ